MHWRLPYAAPCLLRLNNYAPKLYKSYKLGKYAFRGTMTYTKFFLFLFVVLGLAFGGNTSASALPAQPQQSPAEKRSEVCEVMSTDTLTIPHVSKAQELNTDPHSPLWAHAASTWIVKDCTSKIDYPELKTEVR